jgi:L-2-hydroxycarboxylate dehydrogenase (NAD+)
MAEEKISAEKIPADELRSFTQQVFEAAGVPVDDATKATDVLIWASLRGVDTHGIRNLKRYYIDTAGGVGRRDGVIQFDAELTTEHESPTTAALNANLGLGLSVSVRAMNLAIEKAQESGVGIVTVRQSTHFGPAGYFAHMAVPHDMLGFASTGYLFPHGQPKSVVPFGGLLPMLSTNPLAMACPGATGPAFVLDMSTSVVPVNRVEMLEELGRAIPAGWSLDANHQTTDDPDAVQKMEPLGGATQYGGHKGYGLAVAGWILTGLLSGAWRTDPDPNRVLGENTNTNHGFAQEGIGHSFAAVRLDRFGDPDVIKRGLDAMTGAFNDSPAAPGFDRVIIPGQLEAETELERLKNGIPLSPSTAVDLRSLSEEFNIPLSIC